MMTLRVFVRTCKLAAAEKGVTLRVILNGILSRQFSVLLEDGRWVVSTAEAGGATEFGEARGLPASRISTLASNAIDWLDEQGTETPDGLPEKVNRYRVCFGRYTL